MEISVRVWRERSATISDRIDIPPGEHDRSPIALLADYKTFPTDYKMRGVGGQERKEK